MKVIFELPFGGVRGQLLVTSGRDIAHKDLVLKVGFDYRKLTMEESSELNLPFSPRLKSPYVYAADQLANTDVLLPAFSIPQEASRLEIEVAPWVSHQVDGAYKRIRLHVLAPWQGHNKMTVLGESS